MSAVWIILGAIVLIAAYWRICYAIVMWWNGFGRP